MVSVSWKTGVSGNWILGSDWSTGSVPGSSDNVTIGASGAYFVSALTAIDVNSLTVSVDTADLIIDNSSGTSVIKGALFTGGIVGVDTTSGAEGSGYVTPTLTIGGTLGVYASGVFQIGNANLSNGTIVTANALSIGGKVEIDGGSNGFFAKLGVDSAAPTMLTGTFDLTGDALLEYASGGIDSIGSNCWLTLSGSEARISVPTNTVGNSALIGLATNAGTLNFENGASLAITAGLVNNGVINIDGNADGGGSNFDVDDTLTNNNTLTIGASDDSLVTSTTVSVGGLTNTGQVRIYGGAIAQATLQSNGAAPTTLNGDFQLYDHASLNYASGGIESFGANAEILLEGFGAGISDLDASLTSNAGAFNLEDGGDFETFNTFTNTGELMVDTLVGSSLSQAQFNSALVNSGAIDLGPTSGAPADETLVSVSGAVTGTGSFTVGEGATLAFYSTVASGQTIDMQGRDANLILDTNGIAAPVGGFGVSDSIDFFGVTYNPDDRLSYVANAGGTGGVLTIGSSTNVALATVKLNGSYVTAYFSFVKDLQGGTAIVHAPVANDFNGDGYADILFRNLSSGADVMWLSNGGGGYTTVNLASAPAAWSVAGVGDFTDNGLSDILWRDSSTGAISVWDSSGNGAFVGHSLGTVATSWQIAGIGDFNGDGYADILFRNPTSGADMMWESNGSGGYTTVNMPTAAAVWSVAGVGDFTDNGLSDILWSNSSTGDVYLWDSNGTGGFTDHNLGDVATGWQIAGVGDFNGDGYADILFRNPTTGADMMLESNGSGGYTTVNLATAPTAWSVAGIGDFTGNGLSDILWRNSSTGAIDVWDSNGKGGFTGHNLGVVPTSWHIVAA